MRGKSHHQTAQVVFSPHSINRLIITVCKLDCSTSLACLSGPLSKKPSLTRKVSNQKLLLLPRISSLSPGQHCGMTGQLHRSNGLCESHFRAARARDLICVTQIRPIRPLHPSQEITLVRPNSSLVNSRAATSTGFTPYWFVPQVFSGRLSNNIHVHQTENSNFFLPELRSLITLDSQQRLTETFHFFIRGTSTRRGRGTYLN